MTTERIKAALENTLALKGQEYINSLVSNPSDGRRWSSQIKNVDDLVSLNWEEISLPDLDCLYWEGICCFRSTTKSALGLGYTDILDLREVTFPVDFHEDQLIGSQKDTKKTKEAHLILASCQGKEIILTAFPGGLFYDIKKFPGKSIRELRELNIPFAVKPCPVSWIEFQAKKQSVNLKDSILLIGESFSEETNDRESINYGNILNWRDTELNDGIKDQIEKSWRSFLKDLNKHRKYVLVRTEEKVFDIITQISIELLNISVLHISCDYEEVAIRNERIRSEIRGRAVSFRNYKD